MIYGIYIIESLGSNEYFDGENLKDVLQKSLIKVEYSWVDTKEEFLLKIGEFHKSKFRYLHLSCHATRKGIDLNNESISNQELSQFLSDKMNKRRLFISACKGGNRDLAEKVIINNRAFSLIGSPVDISFDKAALFWPSFYHVINEIDSNKMKQKDIRETLGKCANLFKIPINYYSFIRKNDRKVRLLKIRPS